MNREPLVESVGQLLDDGIDPATLVDINGRNIAHAMVTWPVRHIVKAFFGIMEHYSRHPEFDMTDLFVDYEDDTTAIPFEKYVWSSYFFYSTYSVLAFFLLIGLRPTIPLEVDDRIQLYISIVATDKVEPSPFLAALILGTMFPDDDNAHIRVPDPTLTWPNVLIRAARHTVIPTGTLSYIFNLLREYERRQRVGRRPKVDTLPYGWRPSYDLFPLPPNTPRFNTVVALCVCEHALPVTAMIASLGNKYPVWKPSTYRRYPVEHRQLVRLLMLVARRLDATCNGVDIVRLPLEMWLVVIEFLPVKSVPPVAWCMVP